LTAGKESFDPDRAPGFKEDFAVRRQLALDLRRYREEAGMSQIDAAKIATFTPGTWSNMELMRYSTSRLEFLMAAFRSVGKRLRVTVEDLPGPDDAALEEVYAAWAKALEEEASGTSREEAVAGELVRPAPAVHEEEGGGDVSRGRADWAAEAELLLSGLPTPQGAAGPPVRDDHAEELPVQTEART
jgi:transcriptional regulator with XRE-family HTH domain